MKARFKRTRKADELPLTSGRMYDVLDVKTDRRTRKLEEIKVKNDLGQERWYKAHKFDLFAETAAYLKEQAAAGAGAAISIGRNAGRIVYIGIDIAGGTDMTIFGKSIEMADIEKAIAAGIADGFGLHCGA